MSLAYACNSGTMTDAACVAHGRPSAGTRCLLPQSCLTGSRASHFRSAWAVRGPLRVPAETGNPDCALWCWQQPVRAFRWAPRLICPGGISTIDAARRACRLGRRWPLTGRAAPAAGHCRAAHARPRAAHSGNVARVHLALPVCGVRPAVGRTPRGCAPGVPSPATAAAEAAFLPHVKAAPWTRTFTVSASQAARGAHRHATNTAARQPTSASARGAHHHHGDLPPAARPGGHCARRADHRLAARPRSRA
jgi:hypothetical protein